MTAKMCLQISALSRKYRQPHEARRRKRSIAIQTVYQAVPRTCASMVPCSTESERTAPDRKYESPRTQEPPGIIRRTASETSIPTIVLEAFERDEVARRQRRAQPRPPSAARPAAAMRLSE